MDKKDIIVYYSGEINNIEDLDAVESDVFQKIKEQINNNDNEIFIIVGYPGSGKTTIGNQLLIYFKNEFITVDVLSVTDLMHKLENGQNQLFFFDDSFGRDNFQSKMSKWNIFIRKWEEFRRETIQSIKRVLVMSTRPENLPRKLPFKYNAVILEEGNHMFSYKDKINILNFHLNRTKQHMPIVMQPEHQSFLWTETQSQIGFPLSSYLYAYFYRKNKKSIVDPLNLHLKKL